MFLSIRYIQFFIISFLSFIPFIKGGKVARILGGEYANFCKVNVRYMKYYVPFRIMLQLNGPSLWLFMSHKTLPQMKTKQKTIKSLKITVKELSLTSGKY